MSDAASSSSDESDLVFALCAPQERVLRPGKRSRERETLAISSAWRGSAPLEKDEPKKARPSGSAASRVEETSAVVSRTERDRETPTTVHIGNLPKSRQLGGLLEQMCREALKDEASIVGCRVVDKEGARFAFVECVDARASVRLVGALDETEWLGSRLRANFARPRRRPGDPKPRRGLDYEILAEHVDREAAKRVDARAKERREAREAWEAEHGDRVAAERRAARAAGHFGFGFGPAGRPRLHGGYRDFDVS